MSEVEQKKERKLRVLHVNVQAVLVYDDGKELSPGPVMNPVQVKLSELGKLDEEIRESVAQYGSA